MNYNLGDNVYALHITNSQEEISIISGEIDNFHDCVNMDFNFYYYESILLKFKDSFDKDNFISERTIVKYLDIFASKSFSHKTLNPYIPNLSRKFAVINNCTYPISLISTNRRSILKYFNFLKYIFDLENKDIYDFIEKNFR